MTTNALPSSPPRVIAVEGVSKRFTIRRDSSIKERIVTLGRAGRRHREEFWALRDVSIDIHAGSTIGLIGHNGSGKSTLLKSDRRHHRSHDGERAPARTNRRAAGTRGRLPSRSHRAGERLPERLDPGPVARAEVERQFDEIVAFSGIGEFIDTQVKFYSSGMYVRLAFAVAVHTDPDILLVDEVLAVGDEAFQRKCLDKIRTFQAEGRTIVIVSHSLGQITELCDRAVLLNSGRIVYDGDPNTAVAKFRDLLEDRRVAEGGAEAAPVEEPRIIGAALEVLGGDDEGAVLPGSDLRVTVDVDFPAPLEDWRCALQIDTVMGTAVYGTTNARMGVHPPAVVGRRRVEFLLRNARFGEGKYFVNISLMDNAGRHLDDARQVCSFNAAEFPLAAGSMYMEPEFADLGTPPVELS